MMERPQLASAASEPMPLHTTVSELRAAIADDHRIAEADIVRRLRALQPDPAAVKRIQTQALKLAERVRATPPGPLSAESFLRHYGLSPREGWR